MDTLFAIQLTSLLVTFFVGLMLALGRIHIGTVVRRYEESRWMIVSAMAIYSVHYLLQMLFGFRAQGDDVGAVVNILFYAPVAYLMSFSIVNLSSASGCLRRYIVFGSVSYSAILLTFVLGLSFRHSLHMGPYMYIMGAEFFLSICYAVLLPLKENRRLHDELESDTAGDLSMYNRFMVTGTMLLLIIALLLPIAIFVRILLFLIGPVFLVMLFVFAVNFLCLGFGLRPIVDVLDPHEGQPSADSRDDRQSDADGEISADDKVAIQSALDAWMEKGGYTNQDISLGKLAQSIGFPSQTLGRYISISHGVTFRVWLSKIRIEEAKRMLISRPDATIEYIAEECGFSSRSYFQNLFKAETGFTPREWRLKMYGS